MNPMQHQVTDWHKKFDVPVADRPTLISMERRALRIRLIREESEELDIACVKGDMVEMADALADLLYVTFGAAVELGIDMEPIFNEVQRSNMSKLGPGGRPIYDVGGKVLKGPHFSKPDLVPLLLEQHAKANPQV